MLFISVLLFDFYYFYHINILLILCTGSLATLKGAYKKIFFKNAIIVNFVVILKCNPLHHTVQPWNQGSVLRNILHIVKAK